MTFCKIARLSNISVGNLCRVPSLFVFWTFSKFISFWGMKTFWCLQSSWFIFSKLEMNWIWSMKLPKCSGSPKLEVQKSVHIFKLFLAQHFITWTMKWCIKCRLDPYLIPIPCDIPRSLPNPSERRSGCLPKLPHHWPQPSATTNLQDRCLTAIQNSMAHCLFNHSCDS